MAQLVIPNTITSGTEILAAPLQNNFTAVSSWANGNIGTANIEGLAISTDKLANAAVSTAKVADRAITNDKLAVKFASGRQAFVTGDLDTYASPAVTFPIGTFSAPPVVLVSWGGWTDNTAVWQELRPIAVENGSVTKDGFKAVTKSDGTTGKSKVFSWIAVGV